MTSYCLAAVPEMGTAAVYIMANGGHPSGGYYSWRSGQMQAIIETGTTSTGAPEKEYPMTVSLATALDLFAQLTPAEQEEIIALAASLASQQ